MKNIYFADELFEFVASDGDTIIHSPKSFSTVKLNDDAKSVFDYLKNTNSVSKTIEIIQQKYHLTYEESTEKVNKIVELLHAAFIISYNADDWPDIHNGIRYNENVFVNNVYIHITYECNLNCKYCYNRGIRNNIQKIKGHLSVDEWLEALEKLKLGGIKKVVLTGGEALKKKELVYGLAKFCRNNDISISLLTNGTLMEKYDFRLIRLLFDSVQISIDSYEECQNDWIRGAGVYNKCVDAIKSLGKMGVPVTVNAVITKYNVDNICKYVRWCYEELNVKNVQLSYMLPMGNEALKCLQADVETYYSNKRKALKYVPPTIFEQLCKNIVIYPRYHCGAGFGELSIAPNGDLYPCQNLMEDEFKLGNILEIANINDLYGENAILKNLRCTEIDHIPICSGCGLRYICTGGCRANTYKEENSVFAYPATMCKSNQKNAEFLLESYCMLGQYAKSNFGYTTRERERWCYEDCGL